jgi:hypothetical protein
MHRYLKARLLASALVLAAVPTVTATTPSEAAVSISIGFNYFHDNLSNYGDWVYSRRWGRVWRPDVDADFRPYTRGHWVDTDDYGWLWVSEEPFGDITYHYGRWVNDPYDGWLWIPGYVWSPAWVVWRSGSNYTGWMPMPPTEAFLEGDETSYDISDDYDYGYRRWYPDYNNTTYASLWIFVGNRYIGDRDYRRYAVRRPRVTNIIRSTRNVTNYTVVNNYVVNRSISANVVRRAGGRVQQVRAASVIKRPDLITRADRGREIQSRMRKEAPHGTGRPDSAPKPTAEQIQTLSPTIRTRGGKKPVNLLTRAKAQELQQAPNAAKPNADERNAGKPPTPEQKPQEATKPLPGAAAPQTPAEQMRERGRRGREGNEPANAAKPAATAPEQNKPTEAAPVPNKPAESGNRPQERRNNAMPRMDRVPSGNATPEKPAAETPKPETPKPEPVQRQMERVRPMTTEAPAPTPPKPEATPAKPDRSQMRDEMRQRVQERAAPTPQREQTPAAPQREKMQERIQQMRERAQPAAPPAAAPPAAAPPAAAPATAEPRQMQRERPADNERRGNRDNSEKKKDEDKDKNKKPD